MGKRARNRLARHQEYLAAALRVIATDGLDALTMQRLADDVGASIGSTYTYFPSKGALVAEVQREAIERLAASARRLGEDVDAATADAPDKVAALSPVVAFGRFWLTADRSYPDEMQLLLLLLSDVTHSIPDEEAGRVVPAAMRLLGLAADRIGAASGIGALGDGPADERTIQLAAALTGCVQLDVVRKWDPELLDPVSIGLSVLDHLAIGWGANPTALTAAHDIVDAVERTAPLARLEPSTPNDD